MRLLYLTSSVVLLAVFTTFVVVSVYTVTLSTVCLQVLPETLCDFVRLLSSSVHGSNIKLDPFSSLPGNETWLNTIQLVWLASPLKPYVIVLIDSIERHMPGSVVRLHIPIPEDATPDWVSELRERFEYQLAPWLSLEAERHPKIKLELVFHDDVPFELRGTPLENSGIQQHHIGGLVSHMGNERGNLKRGGTPMGDADSGVAHASDILRVIVLWREGGLYLDTDFLILRDLRPLARAYSPMIVADSVLDVVSYKQNTAACNCLLFFPAEHLFIRKLLVRIKLTIDRLSTDMIFPHKTEDECIHCWSVIGPTVLSFTAKDWWSHPDINLRFLKTDFPPSKSPRSYLSTDVLNPEVVLPKIDSSHPSATAVTLAGRRWFMPTYFKSNTFEKTSEQIDRLIKSDSIEFLQQPLIEEHAQFIKYGWAKWFELTYGSAYTVHLWEKVAGSQRFLEIISQTPRTTLGVLFAERICRRLCDIVALKSLVEAFGDPITKRFVGTADNRVKLRSAGV